MRRFLRWDDTFLAGQLVGQHVAGLGHRKIALAFSPLDGNDRATERFDGVMRALEAVNCTVADAWQLEALYSVEAAKEAVWSFFDAGDRPTAVICGNDVLAGGAMHALAKADIRVPGDVTVTGIGDFKGSGA